MSSPMMAMSHFDVKVVNLGRGDGLFPEQRES
jgi:hypothetical protein